MVQQDRDYYLFLLYFVCPASYMINFSIKTKEIGQVEVIFQQITQLLVVLPMTASTLYVKSVKGNYYQCIPLPASWAQFLLFCNFQIFFFLLYMIELITFKILINSYKPINQLTKRLIPICWFTVKKVIQFDQRALYYCCGVFKCFLPPLLLKSQFTYFCSAYYFIT